MGSLALRARDEADNLRDALRAYVALEGLISPLYTSERDDIQATRGEMGAMIRVINAEVQRRVEALLAVMESVREALKAAP